MSISTFFDCHWVLTRSLTITLSITLAWTPFGVAWADAMQAAGSDGQQTGQQLQGGFQFPVDAGSGAMTLNPGTAQESTININTLFVDGYQNPLKTAA
jgi:conjugal transfer mating pair stabilization protein TraN